MPMIRMTITNTFTVIMGPHIIRMTLTNTSTVITGHHIMPMIRMTITNTSTVITGHHIMPMIGSPHHTNDTHKCIHRDYGSRSRSHRQKRPKRGKSPSMRSHIHSRSGSRHVHRPKHGESPGMRGHVRSRSGSRHVRRPGHSKSPSMRSHIHSRSRSRHVHRPKHSESPSGHRCHYRSRTHHHSRSRSTRHTNDNHKYIHRDYGSPHHTNDNHRSRSRSNHNNHSFSSQIRSKSASQIPHIMHKKEIKQYAVVHPVVEQGKFHIRFKDHKGIFFKHGNNYYKYHVPTERHTEHTSSPLECKQNIDIAVQTEPLPPPPSINSVGMQANIDIA
eukprot:1056763_1